MKQTDEVQLAFKREADPQGLLNPGQDDCLGKPRLRLSIRQDVSVQGIGEGLLEEICSVLMSQPILWTDQP